MKRLGLGILKDYEIEYNRPDRLACVQFGDDPMLLGLADRLIDDANRLGANLGVAVVSPGDAGYARELKEQDGLFTVFVRGEKGEARVHREQVVPPRAGRRRTGPSVTRKTTRSKSVSARKAPSRAYHLAPGHTRRSRNA